MVVAKLACSILGAAILLAGCAEDAPRSEAPDRESVDELGAHIAHLDMISLHGALVQFYIQHSRYPGRLEELTEAWPEAALGAWCLEELPVDPWGERYLYRVEEGPPGEVSIRSKGPDGREGTQDDVEDRRPTYVTGR
jgi:hypothetical protein